MKRESLIIGSCLHDIGKFEFRSVDRRRAHTTYGDFFVEEYLTPYSCLAPYLEEIRLLVAHHHDAEAGMPHLRDADHLAAKDRQVDGSPETMRSLVSLLGAVDIGRGPAASNVFRYVPGAVDYRDPMPIELPGVEVADWKPNRQESYAEHKTAWVAFCEDMRRLPDGDVWAWLESLVALMHKHLTRVASAAYRSHPDISLYDHSRAVAALALCLHEADDPVTPFVVLQGDLSGIQRYLYRVASPSEEGASKNMAKRLRGRSLYLDLLGETAALFFLRRLDLPLTNLLYSSGGHFMMVGPNSEALLDRFKDAEKSVNHWMANELGAEITLAISVTPCKKERIVDFPEVMRRSNVDIASAKRRKFAGILEPSLFEPKGHTEPVDVCPVCQAEYPKSEGSECGVCRQHVEAGRGLLNANYLVRVEGSTEVAGSTIEFSGLGFSYYLAEDWAAASRIVDVAVANGSGAVRVDRLSESDFLGMEERELSDRHRTHPIALGFRAVGKHAPVDTKDGGPLEFGELAEKNSEGHPLLGVLRMDVDALGSVFAIGFGEQRALSRIVNLSREMDTFFQGHINELARRRDIYITYAGGDDLFAVGSWINALYFARDVKQAFSTFACNNPNLTISAGIFVCKESYPIGRAAEQAGALEEASKQVDGKDAVTVFGETVGWSRLDELLDYGDDLYRLVDEGEIPLSVLYQVLELVRQRQRDTNDRRVWMQTQVRLKYLVARRGATSRAIDSGSSDTPNGRRIGALGRLVNDPELLEQINIPISYAIYRSRGTRGEPVHTDMQAQQEEV